MWNQIEQLRPMAVPVPIHKSISAIEARFPHIARRLEALWQTPQIDLYMDSLLIDTRGSRQGFPPDVLDELMFLSGMLWHLQTAGNTDDLQKPDVFSFSASNEADMRRCGTTGAWVLL